MLSPHIARGCLGGDGTRWLARLEENFLGGGLLVFDPLEVGVPLEAVGLGVPVVRLNAPREAVELGVPVEATTLGVPSMSISSISLWK